MIQGPLYHPTDVGHIKLASHLMQYIKLKFDWVLGATGPEVQADTLYWNDGTYRVLPGELAEHC